MPVVYRLEESGAPGLTVTLEYGITKKLSSLSLSESMSGELFLRSGHIRQIEVNLTAHDLLAD